MKLLNELRLPKDLRALLDSVRYTVFWPVIFLAFLSCISAQIGDGVAAHEEGMHRLLQPSYSIVEVRTDRRRGNSFISNPDFLNRIRQSSAEISSVVQIEAEVEAPAIDQTGRIRRWIDFYFVTDNFFEAIRGRLDHGRTFSKDDFLSGRPLAVLTPGAAESLYGSSALTGTHVFVAGKPVDVIGKWQFEGDTLRENQSILMPLSTLGLVADEHMINLRRFLLKGNSEGSLRKLKGAILQAQLDAGMTPVSPEYTVRHPTLSKRNNSIWILKKQPLDIFILTASAIFLLVWFLALERSLSRTPVLSAWRALSPRIQDQPRGALTRSLLQEYFLSAGLGFICAYLFSLPFQLLFEVPFSVFPTFHLAYAILLVGAPMGMVVWVRHRTALPIKWNKWLRH